MTDVVFEPAVDGLANSLYLTSRTHLYPCDSLDDTLALNAPIAFPLPEKQRVLAGKCYRASFRYRLGEGYGSFDASVATS